METCKHNLSLTFRQQPTLQNILGICVSRFVRIRVQICFLLPTVGEESANFTLIHANLQCVPKFVTKKKYPISQLNFDES